MQVNVARLSNFHRPEATTGLKGKLNFPLKWCTLIGINHAFQFLQNVSNSSKVTNSHVGVRAGKRQTACLTDLLIPPTLIGSAPISGTSSGQKGWRNSWPERSRGPDLPTTTWVNGEFLKSYYPLLTVVVSCPTKNVMYILDPLESNSFGYALSIPVGTRLTVRSPQCKEH